MHVTLPLAQMTIADKLMILEVLWQDLCQSDTEVPSPSWHEDVLIARQKRLASDNEPVSDWEESKRRIRESTQ